MTTLQHTISAAMGDLTSALAMGDLGRILYAITAWRDEAVEDGFDERDADLMADVVTDAMRQAFERRAGQRAVRITYGDGKRLTLSWDAKGGLSDKAGKWIFDALDRAQQSEAEG